MLGHNCPQTERISYQNAPALEKVQGRSGFSSNLRRNSGDRRGDYTGGRGDLLDCQVGSPRNRPDRCTVQYVYDLSTNSEQRETSPSPLARTVLPGRLRLAPRQIVKGAQRPVLLPLKGESDAGWVGMLQGIPRHILRRKPAHVQRFTRDEWSSFDVPGRE